jgi:hypothetical protein
MHRPREPITTRTWPLFDFEASQQFLQSVQTRRPQLVSERTNFCA